MKKLTTFILLAVMTLSLCACNSSSTFETVYPPIKAFPTPEPYDEVEVICDTFRLEKSFRGNKMGDNYLRMDSSALATTGFKTGEKGYITFGAQTPITVEATLILCPESGFGTFIAEFNSPLAYRLPQSYPGKFWVTVLEIPNALLLPKNAVIKLDDEGNALVHKLDENGLLKELLIKIGYENSEYYQVVSGLSVGEKVVLK